MIKLFVTILVVFPTIFFFGCGSSDNTDNTDSITTLDGQKLLTERCSACHSLDRVYQEKTDRSGWEKIINDMI